MKLCDFLILVLAAHAQTLLRLAALFGEDTLIEMLELSGERERGEELRPDPAWVVVRSRARAPGRAPAKAQAAQPSPANHRAQAPVPAAAATAGGEANGEPPHSPYRALESAVREFGLPSILEFHLWAYPFYRSLIEADLGLDAELAGPSGDHPSRIPIIEAAVAQSELWVRGLPIPPALAARAEQAARTPWMRFRTESFRRMGHRPIGVVT